MADRNDFEDLEGALRTLGRQLDVPPASPAPSVALAVRTRLESRQDSQLKSRPKSRTPARSLRIVRYAAVAVALLVSGVMIAVPDVRAAVLELLRIGGVVVHEGPAPSLPAEPALPEQPVADLAEAERLTGLRPVVPQRLGPPDRILVIDRRVISLEYGATANRPAIRLDQFNGQLEPGFEKFLWIEELRPVSIGQGRGWWVPGPHELVYVDAAGQQHRESARLAEPTLIWEREEVTFRLEGALTLERAVTIAESLPS